MDQSALLYPIERVLLQILHLFGNHKRCISSLTGEKVALEGRFQVDSEAAAECYRIIVLLTSPVHSSTEKIKINFPLA